MTLTAQPVLNVNSIAFEQLVNEMIFDSVRQRIVLTIPALDTVYGNGLGVLDPITAQLTGTLDMGSEPGPIDITDNGQFAWVGVTDTAAVVKVDLNVLQVVQATSLGVDGSGSHTVVKRITCQPGSDTAFGVIKSYSNDYDYFNGDSLLYGNGSFQYTGEDLHFKSSDPDRMIGLSSFFGTGYLASIAVESSEMQVLSYLYGLYEGTVENNRMSILGDLALTNDGSVIDIASDLPLPIGSCYVPADFTSRRSACFDPYQGLICIAFLKPATSDTLRILRFDIETLLAQDAIDVPMIGSGWRQAEQVLCWGPDLRYAVKVSNGTMVIINGEILPTSTADEQRTMDTPYLFTNGMELWAYYPSPVRFDLFDMNGRLLGQSDMQGRLALHGLPSSVYAVRFWSLDGTYLGGKKWVRSM